MVQPSGLDRLVALRLLREALEKVVSYQLPVVRGTEESGQGKVVGSR